MLIRPNVVVLKKGARGVFCQANVSDHIDFGQAFRLTYSSFELAARDLVSNGKQEKQYQVGLFC